MTYLRRSLPINWTEPGLTITEFKVNSLAVDGFRQVQVCKGMLEGKKKVYIVKLPFDSLPAANVSKFLVGQGIKAGVKVKDINLLNALTYV